MTQEFASLKAEVEDMHLYFLKCIQDALRKVIQQPPKKLNVKEKTNSRTALSNEIDPLGTQTCENTPNVKNVSSGKPIQKLIVRKKSTTTAVGQPDFKSTNGSESWTNLQFPKVRSRPCRKKRTESAEERAKRLQVKAEIARIRRERETPEQRAKRLKRMSEGAKYRRRANTPNVKNVSSGTSTPRALRLIARKQSTTTAVGQPDFKNTNGSESWSNLKLPKMRSRPCKTESSEERTKRLRVNAEVARIRREQETPEQRAERLKRMSERVKFRRHLVAVLEGTKRAPQKERVHSRPFAAQSASDENPNTDPTNNDNKVTEILCDLCGKASTSKRGMHCHKHFHNSDASNFECTICSKSFVNQASLMVHCNNFHIGEKPFKCKHCGQAWNGFKDLKNHRDNRVCLLKDVKTCELCGRKCVNPLVLAQHIKNIHEAASEDSGRVCDICGACFAKRIAAVQHHISHTHPELKRFECLHCGSAFKQKSTLRSHSTKLHKNEELFFKENEEYLSLMAAITKSKYTYKNNSNAGSSSKKDSSNQDPVNVLHHEIMSESSLSLELPLVEICEETENAATRKGEMETEEDLIKSHETHPVEMNLLCDEEDGLPGEGLPLAEQPQDTAENERDRNPDGVFVDRPTQEDNMMDIIVCDTCGRKFSNQQYFDIHTKTHVGALLRPTAVLQCDICGKEFSSSYTMWEHRNIHTKEKPFKCSTCGVRKNQRSNMSQHYKIWHKDIKVVAYELNNAKYPRPRSPGDQWLKKRVEGCSGKPIIKKVIRPDALRVYYEAQRQQSEREGNQCEDAPACYADKPDQSNSKMDITCDFCEKKFGSQLFFYRHTKVYFDDLRARRKPKCDFCDKEFKTLAIMQDHRNIHTNEKPYKCSTCGVRTNQHSGMYQHYRIRHKNVKVAYQLNNIDYPLPANQKVQSGGRPKRGVEGCPGKPTIQDM